MSKQASGQDENRKIREMITLIDAYTNAEETVIPILKEVCCNNYWDYNEVMRLQNKNEALRKSIERLNTMKEVRLERLALMRQIDKTMAVFSLKQMGWQDKPEQRGEDPHIEIHIVPIEPREGIKDGEING